MLLLELYEHHDILLELTSDEFKLLEKETKRIFRASAFSPILSSHFRGRLLGRERKVDYHDALDVIESFANRHLKQLLTLVALGDIDGVIKCHRRKLNIGFVVNSIPQHPDRYKIVFRTCLTTNRSTFGQDKSIEFVV